MCAAQNRTEECEDGERSESTSPDRGSGLNYSVDDEFGEIYHVHQKRTVTPPYSVKVTLDDALLEMELDTGAAVSIISKATYQQLWEVTPKLMPTTTCLRTYSGQHLVVLGTLKVDVQYEAQQVDHSILVVEGSGPSLFGRDLLTVLKLNWKSLEIHNTSKYPSLNGLLAKHEAVFSSKLGRAKNIEAKLNVEAGATPQFYKARSVPYALNEKIERELDRLQADGIIEPMTFSDWAAPIVPC